MKYNNFGSGAAFVSAFHVVILIIFVAGCERSHTYPHRPITLVCPWSQGGGTDRCSRQIAVHLEKELGVPVNVINATGGKGVTGHNRGMSARPDGYTLLMATLELSTMHWSKLTELTYKDCIPLVSINEDYAALMVRHDAPWKSLAELEAAIQATPGKLTCSGTATGGAWHLGVAGWLIAKGMNVEDVIWVSHQGAGPSIQDLMTGKLDMVCCALPEARPQLLSGELRSLGVMSPKRAIGFDDVPTFKEQGTDWSLGGWRAIAVASGTPPTITDVLLKALHRIVQGESRISRNVGGKMIEESFPAFMAVQAFDSTWRSGDELESFLQETDEKFGKLLTSEAMQSVNRDPFNSMLYPSGIMVILLATFLGVVVLETKRPSLKSEEQITTRGLVGFGLFVAAILFYVFFAETLGFVITASLLLLATLLFLRNKKVSLANHMMVSVVVTVLFVPLTYQLFAVGLRVPLPQGIFGW